jgi:hypothetical protein
MSAKERNKLHLFLKLPFRGMFLDTKPGATSNTCPGKAVLIAFPEKSYALRSHFSVPCSPQLLPSVDKIGGGNGYIMCFVAALMDKSPVPQAISGIFLS